MSEWFHVGQKVVCINAVWYGDFVTASPLEHGRVYTVARIGVNFGRSFDDDLACGPSLVLVEVANPDDCWERDGFEGFDARRFRPLRKRTTDISIFKEMLVSPPKEVVDA